MSRFQLISFNDSHVLARAAADEWLKQLRARQSGSPYCVALSGGRIARRFLSAVADSAGAGDFQSVHFFWSDERCVPPEDPQSNFGLACDTLLKPLEIPTSQIHRIQGERPPQAAALEAEKELRKLTPSDPDGQPTLDMVFLGMGEEGHVASLFPGESEQSLVSRAAFRPVLAPKPPPCRITMSYPVIAAARQVWVLVSGANKAQVLRDSLAPDGRTPLARVLQLRPQTRIFEALSD